MAVQVFNIAQSSGSGAIHVYATAASSTDIVTAYDSNGTAYVFTYGTLPDGTNGFSYSFASDKKGTYSLVSTNSDGSKYKRKSVIIDSVQDYYFDMDYRKVILYNNGDDTENYDLTNGMRSTWAGDYYVTNRACPRTATTIVYLQTTEAGYVTYNVAPVLATNLTPYTKICFKGSFASSIPHFLTDGSPDGGLTFTLVDDHYECNISSRTDTLKWGLGYGPYYGGSSPEGYINMIWFEE